MENKKVVIEIYGEGATELGMKESRFYGIIETLICKISGNPLNIAFQPGKIPAMQGGGLYKKIIHAKRRISYGMVSGIVFVVDTEGEHPKKLQEIKKGRDPCPNDFPMAVGVAHPCIEAWLLADAKAIHKGLELAECPNVPDQPEELPAPCQDRERNPKTELGKCTNSKRCLSAKDMSSIASKIKNLNIVRERCPKSFAPFADEVESRIKPLFETDDSDPGTMQM